MQCWVAILFFIKLILLKIPSPRPLSYVFNLLSRIFVSGLG